MADPTEPKARSLMVAREKLVLDIVEERVVRVGDAIAVTRDGPASINGVEAPSIFLFEQKIQGYVDLNYSSSHRSQTDCLLLCSLPSPSPSFINLHTHPPRPRQQRHKSSGLFQLYRILARVPVFKIDSRLLPWLPRTARRFGRAVCTSRFSDSACQGPGRSRLF